MQKNLFGEDVHVDHTAEPADFWVTPARLYPKDCFDPCPVNPEFDGLAIAWHGDAFVNPPYSQIPAWIAKALKERENCLSVVMLLPNWTERVRFLDPITFQPSKDNPPFGSMLVHIK
jgi:hypothetical protein